jgi:hypothetical protein
MRLFKDLNKCLFLLSIQNKFATLEMKISDHPPQTVS